MVHLEAVYSCWSRGFDYSQRGGCFFNKQRSKLQSIQDQRTNVLRDFSEAGAGKSQESRPPPTTQRPSSIRKCMPVTMMFVIVLAAVPPLGNMLVCASVALICSGCPLLQLSTLQLPTPHQTPNFNHFFGHSHLSHIHTFAHHSLRGVSRHGYPVRLSSRESHPKARPLSYKFPALQIFSAN